jgi:beta-lactamase superfamily II metal-dependent hydrolase
VNAASTRSVANGTSAVVVVEFGGTNVILTGDATAETLAEINSTLMEWPENPIEPCYLLTAPHHGALATISSGFTTRNPRLEVATEFANIVSADNVAASAGYESHFLHPYKNVMALLSAHSGADSAEHTYVVYDNSVGKWEAVEDTEENVFTTICSLDDPPVRKSWYFTLWPDGKVSFEGRLTPASAREQAARHAAIAARPKERT